MEIGSLINRRSYFGAFWPFVSLPVCPLLFITWSDILSGGVSEFLSLLFVSQEDGEVSAGN